jgi:hypothetical protein
VITLLLSCALSLSSGDLYCERGESGLRLYPWGGSASVRSGTGAEAAAMIGESGACGDGARVLQVDRSGMCLQAALRAHPMVLGTQQQQSRQITSFSTGADRAAAWVTCARTSQKG